jgi:hypothetical protein
MLLRSGRVVYLRVRHQKIGDRAFLAMQEYEFDPPLALQGDIVVATLDDAAAFARSLISPRLPKTRDNVLRCLERADSELQQGKVADIFRFWASSEGVLLKNR